MSWNCAQLEEHLGDYLEGRLPEKETAQADRHARTCPRCREHLLARRATGWLRELEPLESPPGLETRILALTVAPPPKESFWAVLPGLWQALRKPRVVWGLAAAALSVALVLNALDVSVRNLEPADLNPANLYHGMKRQAHLTYAKGSRFVNDLWLVYEIRSRLDELTTQEGEQAPESTRPDNHNRKKQNRQGGAARIHWLLASQQPPALGDLR